MGFNELNSVEHYIIHELSGVNLNAENVREISEPRSHKWVYKSSSNIKRESTQDLVETELRDALIRLNPDINADPKKADEVIYKLRAILLSINETGGLVKANEEFIADTGEKSLPWRKQ